MTQVPRPDLEEFNLDWAVDIWKTAGTYDPETIRQALEIVRYWHADRVDMLRRSDKGSPVWIELKHDEELLEVYLAGLKDALLTRMHINKMTGGS